MFMLAFKRAIKGYYHYFVLDVLYAYCIFISEAGSLLQILFIVLFAECMIVLLRCISITYLTITDTQLIIKGDYFITKSIRIDDLSEIRLAKGLFPFGRIRTKDGASMIFRSGYLSNQAKAALLNLRNINPSLSFH